MSAAGFILGINLFATVLLSVAFQMLAGYDRCRSEARWMALAYGVGAGFFVIEAFIPSLTDARLAVTAAALCLAGALAALDVGLAKMYRAAVPWKVLAGLLIATGIIDYAIQVLPRNAPLRLISYQLPLIALQCVGVHVLLKAKQRQLSDNALLVLLVLSALQFASRPFLVLAYGGEGNRPQDYINSSYALLSQSLGTVFFLAVALLLLSLLARLLLSDATARSKIDVLSGLLNRRGFEEHAHHAVREALRSHRPLAIVIADLDNFKRVNDSYGHAAGDAVISGFGRFLSAAVAPDAIVGRLGGEEFAVVLPGTGAAAARLFAEGARSGFALQAIAGAPAELRVTASFGVAELMPAETIGDVLRRADLSLYEAKNNGRDCVRVSQPPLRNPPMRTAAG